MDLYIYYKARSGLASELSSRVLGMQSTLTRETPVAATLKRRPTEKDGCHTWMEVYLNVPDGFGSMLEQAVAKFEIACLIDGERHTEYFVDCSPCA